MKQKGTILMTVILCLAGGALLFLAWLGAYAWVRMGARIDGCVYPDGENHANGEFRNLEPAVSHLKKFSKSGGLFRFLFASPNKPEFPLPAVKPEFARKPGDYKVTWLGHSTLIIELSGKRILTDPVFGNAAPVPLAVKRYSPPVITAEELPPIDIVLLSHDHYDHLEYESCVFLEHKWKPLFVTTSGTGAHLRYWGIPAKRIVELNWHTFTVCDPVTITALPARHFSGRTLTGRNRALWASFAIDDGVHRIFFGGDSAYGKHFQLIGDTYGPFDLACVEIDAWNPRWPDVHLFPHRLPAVIREIKAAKFLPIHWGVFDLALHPWDRSIRQVSDLCFRAGIPLLTPQMGETLDLNCPAATKQWWRKNSRNQ